MSVLAWYGETIQSVCEDLWLMGLCLLFHGHITVCFIPLFQGQICVGFLVG